MTFALWGCTLGPSLLACHSVVHGWLQWCIWQALQAPSHALTWLPLWVQGPGRLCTPAALGQLGKVVWHQRLVGASKAGPNTIHWHLCRTKACSILKSAAILQQQMRVQWQITSRKCLWLRYMRGGRDFLISAAMACRAPRFEVMPTIIIKGGISSAYRRFGTWYEDFVCPDAAALACCPSCDTGTAAFAVGISNALASAGVTSCVLRGTRSSNMFSQLSFCGAGPGASPAAMLHI